jgi:hypothetical protein
VIADEQLAEWERLEAGYWATVSDYDALGLAHEAIPALIAEVRRLRSAVADLRSRCAKVLRATADRKEELAQQYRNVHLLDTSSALREVARQIEGEDKSDEPLTIAAGPAAKTGEQGT